MTEKNGTGDAFKFKMTLIYAESNALLKKNDVLKILL